MPNSRRFCFFYKCYGHLVRLNCRLLASPAPEHRSLAVTLIFRLIDEYLQQFHKKQEINRLSREINQRA